MLSVESAREQQIGLVECRGEEAVGRPVQFALREGPQFQECGPTGERLRDRRHGQEVCGSVEDELSPAGILVDDVLHRAHERLAGQLDLVECAWRLPEGCEPGRVVQRGPQCRLPVEARERAGSAQRAPHKRGLSRLARARDHHHSEGGERFAGYRFEAPRQLLHRPSPVLTTISSERY